MADFGTLGIPGLYQNLPRTIQHKMDMLGVRRNYQPDQLIQNRGDTTRGFSIIKKGAVRFGKTDIDGRFIAAAVFERGQCYGEFTLFADLPRTHDGFAVSETEIQHIGKAAFDRLLLEESQLAHLLLSSLTNQLHNALEWIDDMRRYPLNVYLGKRLLRLAESGTEQVEVTQSELADMLGVSRVAVGKVLKDYQRQGFVDLRYGGIDVVQPMLLKEWLRDRTKLEAMASK